MWGLGGSVGGVSGGIASAVGRGNKGRGVVRVSGDWVRPDREEDY